MRRPGLDPRLALLVTAAALGAAVAFPLGVIASHQFSDVPNTNTFHADIDAIADAGVTTGCGPNIYCPADFVTREQMAAFLNRLGALGPGKTPVVNADKLDGRDSTAFLTSGDIVHRQLGPWLPLAASNVTVEHGSLASSMTQLDGPTPGSGWVRLNLNDAGMIGGRAYGLEHVDICFDDSPNTVITHTTVQQVTDVGVNLISNGTDRPMGVADCYRVTDPTPSTPQGGLALFLQVTWQAGATIAYLAGVTTTWVPIAP